MKVNESWDADSEINSIPYGKIIMLDNKVGQHKIGQLTCCRHFSGGAASGTTAADCSSVGRGRRLTPGAAIPG